MNIPLFSIIIPVYNVAPYLRECLDSVFAQDCTDYEVCMVDDGSTDDSGGICDEYMQRYPALVKLLHQSNQGVSVARNAALDMATGRYIWFVDADDYILPGSLGYLKEVIQASGSDTIFFGSDYHNFYAGNKEVTFKSDERENFLKSHICYCNPLMIFDRRIIEDNALRFTKGMKMGEDLEFQYKYLLHCVNPIATQCNFYCIRERPGSASRSSASAIANLESGEVLLENMIKYLQCLDVNSFGWIQGRIAERLKSFLQSASAVNDVDWHEVQHKYDHFVQAYKNLGFGDISKGSLRIANMDVRLYSLIYRIIMKIKNKA